MNPNGVGALDRTIGNRTLASMSSIEQFSGIGRLFEATSVRSVLLSVRQSTFFVDSLKVVLTFPLSAALVMDRLVFALLPLVRLKSRLTVVTASAFVILSLVPSVVPTLLFVFTRMFPGTAVRFEFRMLLKSIEKCAAFGTLGILLVKALVSVICLAVFEVATVKSDLLMVWR